jgi:hypothetical protein
MFTFHQSNFSSHLTDMSGKTGTTAGDAGMAHSFMALGNITNIM